MDEWRLVFDAKRGRGPVGTGIHVMRLDHDRADAVAHVWFTLLFLPLLPLGLWVLRDGRPGADWSVVRVLRPSLARSLAWWVGGLGWLLMMLAPAFCAIAFFMGSLALQLGGMFSTALLLVASLGWLDETRDRVPLRTASRILRETARPPRTP